MEIRTAGKYRIIVLPDGRASAAFSSGKRYQLLAEDARDREHIVRRLSSVKREGGMRVWRQYARRGETAWLVDLDTGELIRGPGSAE